LQFESIMSLTERSIGNYETQLYHADIL